MPQLRKQNSLEDRINLREKIIAKKMSNEIIIMNLFQIIEIIILVFKIIFKLINYKFNY